MLAGLHLPIVTQHVLLPIVTHYVLLSRIDSYCEAVWNPIIISRQGTSQQQVEYRAKL